MRRVGSKGAPSSDKATGDITHEQARGLAADSPALAVFQKTGLPGLTGQVSRVPFTPG